MIAAPLVRAMFAALAGVCLSIPALAADPAMKPEPAPAPKAGPTMAAAQGFCGEAIAKADDLIARYTSASSLKQVYKSDQFLAYSDDEKNPTVTYTFTVKAHPAHPAAVCRKVVKEGDNLIIKMDIVCDGNADACTDLKREFNVMTAQMQQHMDEMIKSGGK